MHDSDDKTVISRQTPEQKPAHLKPDHTITRADAPGGDKTSPDLKTERDERDHARDGSRRTRLIRLMLIASIIGVAAGLGGFTAYERREQSSLTDSLSRAVGQGDMVRAQKIVADIGARGYASDAIAKLKKRVAGMVALQDTWDGVVRYYQTGMFKEARTGAEAFTANAAYRERATALLGQIAAKRANDLFKTAARAYAGGDRRQALTLAQEALDADPSNKDAKALLAMIRQGGLKPRASAYASPGAGAALSPPSRGKAHAPGAGDRAYASGDYGLAVKLWTGTHVAADAKKIVMAGNVRKYVSIGKKAFASHDYHAALQALKKADGFVSALGIHHAADGEVVRKYLCMTYTALGRRALAESAYARARSYFEEALKNVPSDAEASQSLSDLNTRAESIYRQAYAISSANAAESCRLYRQALQMARGGTDVYKKIERRAAACRQ